MPTLPTFTVTQTQADRLMAAFGGVTDETGAAVPPATAYKMWLRSQLVNFVLRHEATTELQDNLPL